MINLNNTEMKTLATQNLEKAQVNMETLRNKIENSDMIRVSGALEGFIVTSPSKGIYNVTTSPHGGTYEWNIDNIILRIQEMHKLSQEVEIDEFDFVSNKWVKI